VQKTVVIVQSNYLPWRGYFDLLRRADEFILLDSVQYTRRDWRNRNLIKTPAGTQWLTVPVQVKGRFVQSIDETQTAGSAWASAHIRAIEFNYRKAAAFADMAPWLFGELQSAAAMPLLSQLNERLIKSVAEKLAIKTPIRGCTSLIERAAMAAMDATERLVALCVAAGAGRYLSGPAAKDYLDVAAFAAKGIEVEWMNYSSYPEYSQLWGAFEPRLSIVDLLLNIGSEAVNYLGAK
jgi:WbqC-like protein family